MPALPSNAEARSASDFNERLRSLLERSFGTDFLEQLSSAKGLVPGLTHLPFKVILWGQCHRQVMVV